MNKISFRTYIVALVITALVFATALFITNRISVLRVSQLSSIQEKIATDILSLETQFALLEQVSCEDLAKNPLFSRELGSLGDRLQSTEAKLGTTNPKVIALKKQYTLLQIKDQLLLKRVGEQCKTKTTPILYFYSNDCDSCTRAGYALSLLREKYPDLRVYSFDYDLPLPALQTLTSIYDIQRNDLPVFIIDGKRTNGFTTFANLTNELPEKILSATSTETKKQSK